MGSIFSGNFNGRSSLPFLDQLPAISVADIKRNVGATDSFIYLPYLGSIHPVRVLIIRAGVTDQLRFSCPSCTRRCRILYLGEQPKCNRCSGRYRVQSESPGRRTERKAWKVLERATFDYSRPDGKIAWRRWKTHKWILAQAIEAAEVVCARQDGVIHNLRRIREKERKAPKSSILNPRNFPVTSLPSCQKLTTTKCLGHNFQTGMGNSR
ncbi:MAG: hypothetical protein K0S36_2098 [Nitrosospira multiformis]|nr:hypothetical protein [Nitrosospira multiformis]